MSLRIYFYKSSKGREIVKDCINSLDDRAVVIIKTFLDKFEKDLEYRRMPYCRKLNKKIFEIRIKVKSDYRILYAYMFQDSIILLHVFKKKTNKTPKKEINLAIKRLKLYEN